jgi:hypothetical protein
MLAVQAILSAVILLVIRPLSSVASTSVHKLFCAEATEASHGDYVRDRRVMLGNVVVVLSLDDPPVQVETLPSADKAQVRGSCHGGQ